MSERRYNPETGVLEEEGIFGWSAVKTADGQEQRINPATGVYEEEGFFGWSRVEDADGYASRVNPATGVHERESLFGWTPVTNADDREERVNPETGVFEEHRWYGWSAKENAEGWEERIHPGTGVYQQRTWFGWMGIEHPDDVQSTNVAELVRHERTPRVAGWDGDVFGRTSRRRPATRSIGTVVAIVALLAMVAALTRVAIRSQRRAPAPVTASAAPVPAQPAPAPPPKETYFDALRREPADVSQRLRPGETGRAVELPADGGHTYIDVQQPFTFTCLDMHGDLAASDRCGPTSSDITCGRTFKNCYFFQITNEGAAATDVRFWFTERHKHLER